MNDTPPQKTYKPFGWLFQFFGWLFSWRTLRRTLIALVGLTTLVALFYSVENWRGKRAWEAYKQEQEAKGVRFDLAAFVPPEVPDEENFAMWPALEPLFHVRPAHQGSERSDLAQNVGTINGDWNKSTKIDLALWWKTRRPEDPGLPSIDHLTRPEQALSVLTALKENERLLDEIRAASQRPYARFSVDYDREDPLMILLPHLAPLKSLCQVLAVRGSAALAGGKTGAASKDVDLIFYLADTTKAEPFTVSLLVRIACLHYGIQLIWEGLAEHQWSEEQLQQWQSHLLQMDLLAETRRTYQSERAIGNWIVRNHGRRWINAIMQGHSLESLSGLKDEGFARFVPRGWLYLEQLNSSRLFDERLLPAVDPESQRIDSAMIRSNRNEAAHLIRSFPRHEILGRSALGYLSTPALRSARLQSAVHQAAIACALERYRMLHGSYPETLDQLLPKFLDRIPNDTITGKPMNYRRDADGSFVLYSIGSDERDDGGTPLRAGSNEGDWVWRYPPSLPASADR